MNNKLKDIKKSILYDGHYQLHEYSYEYFNLSKQWERQTREIFDRGHGAVVLLYNLDKKTVILVEQFRMPVFVNGQNDGSLLEACAGLLEDNDPKTAIAKEIEEETGYRISENNIKKVFEAYSSPGAVTEVLYYFVAPYQTHLRVSEGGGATDETENIIVKEIPFAKAVEQMNNGQIKDAKTLILLQYAQLHLF